MTRTLFLSALVLFAGHAASAATVMRDDFSNTTSGWPDQAATRDTDLGFAVYTDSGQSPMDKSFANPQDFETRWYAQWEQSGCFKPSGQGPPYTIMLPPPNVTGTLHMGHAFQHTLMDTLIRYHRMRGFDTLWQIGTDHAGIATEMVVSPQPGARRQGRDPRLARARGLHRESVGVEAGIRRHHRTPDAAPGLVRATGRAAPSPWTTWPRPRCSKPSCACTKKA
jgi:hypothetical protein